MALSNLASSRQHMKSSDSTSPTLSQRHQTHPHTITKLQAKTMIHLCYPIHIILIVELTNTQEYRSSGGVVIVSGLVVQSQRLVTYMRVAGGVISITIEVFDILSEMGTQCRMRWIEDEQGERDKVSILTVWGTAHSCGGVGTWGGVYILGMVIKDFMGRIRELIDLKFDDEGIKNGATLYEDNLLDGTFEIVYMYGVESISSIRLCCGFVHGPLKGKMLGRSTMGYNDVEYCCPSALKALDLLL
ncbi:hypothetical protein Tco_1041835 [Tanacetum coccineum]|uniref:Uncharacterized protein n=1 Tax=Tanacetum coccineum TaxID=301880 RepID=A0ABQ5GH97_9ASTR